MAIKDVANKYAIKVAPKFLVKNGVPPIVPLLAFLGLRGSVSVKMTTKISVMILDIKGKILVKIENVYDVFVKTKTVVSITFTKKYYVHVTNRRRAGITAAEIFQRELAKKKSILFRTIMKPLPNRHFVQ